MLGFYDHGGGFVTNLTKAAESKELPYNRIYSGNDLLNPDELSGYQIFIAHISNDKVWEKLLNNSQKDTVRRRVSSVGFSRASQKPPPRPNGGYEFHFVLPANGLTENQWQEILTGFSKQTTIETLVAGKDPKGLRHFFVHEHENELLPALAILCQGYLAVHAQSQGSATNWNREDIASALEQMGWINDCIENTGHSLGISNLGNKVDIVRKASWWLEVFETQETLRESVGKEWKGMGIGSLPKELENLLESISSKSQLDSPKIVADVYLASPID